MTQYYRTLVSWRMTRFTKTSLDKFSCVENGFQSFTPLHHPAKSWKLLSLEAVLSPWLFLNSLLASFLSVMVFPDEPVASLAKAFILDPLLPFTRRVAPTWVSLFFIFFPTTFPWRFDKSACYLKSSVYIGSERSFVQCASPSFYFWSFFWKQWRLVNSWWYISSWIS